MTSSLVKLKKVEKLIVIKIGFMVLKRSVFNSWIQRKKNQIESVKPEPRYEQKRMKIWRFGLFCQIFTVFGLFLGTGLTDLILVFCVETVSQRRFF